MIWIRLLSIDRFRCPRWISLSLMGENPRWWRDQCVLYFEVYTIHAPLKTRFAALNFQGAAATWLQTVQRRGRITDWDKLCELVFAKFDKDQYSIQLR